MELKEKRINKDVRYAFNLTLAVVAGQVGCLTLIIILVALFGGLWLDSKLETRPMFTVGLMIASIPINLLLMFWIVRAATSRLSNNQQVINKVNAEDE